MTACRKTKKLCKHNSMVFSSLDTAAVDGEDVIFDWPRNAFNFDGHHLFCPINCLKALTHTTLTPSRVGTLCLFPPLT